MNSGGLCRSADPEQSGLAMMSLATALGRSWPVSEQSWGRLGGQLRAFRTICGAVLGPSGRPFGGLVAALASLKAILERSLAVVELSGAIVEAPLGSSWGYLGGFLGRLGGPEAASRTLYELRVVWKRYGEKASTTEQQYVFQACRVSGFPLGNSLVSLGVS